CRETMYPQRPWLPAWHEMAARLKGHPRHWLALERPALGRQAVLRGVYVEKIPLGKTGCCQFALLDHADGDVEKRGIDLILPCLQRLLGGSAKVATIDRTKRLKTLVAARHGDGGVSVLCHREKKREKLPGDEGHVNREHQVQLGRRIAKRGVNTGEGTAARENVGHD